MSDRALRRQLFERPQEFDFFQAVRLLEHLEPDRAPVGEFADPDEEALRFTSATGVAFPPSAIQSLQESDDASPARMTVSFLGLTGPQGVLPLDYSLYIAQRMRAGDSTLRDFLALFDHRIVSLFYRAWAKTHAVTGFESAQDAEPGDDARRRRDWLTRHLQDLVGLGAPTLQGRLPIPDHTLLHYAGLLGLPSRPAVALEQLIGDYFDVPVEIQQFVGAWYPLDERTQSAIGDDAAEAAPLGGGAVAGDEVWDQQARVRIRIGPLTRAQYDTFLPRGHAHETLRALTQFFGNDQLDFEIQLVLAKEDAPCCELGADGAPLPLGWSTWLRTGPLDRDPDDTVFVL